MGFTRISSAFLLILCLLQQLISASNVEEIAKISKVENRKIFINALIDSYLDAKGEDPEYLSSTYQDQCQIKVENMIEAANTENINVHTCNFNLKADSNELLNKETVKAVLEIMKKEKQNKVYVDDIAQIYLMPTCRRLSNFKTKLEDFELKIASSDFANVLANAYFEKSCKKGFAISALFAYNPDNGKMEIKLDTMLKAIKGCTEMEVPKSIFEGHGTSCRNEHISNKRLISMLAQMKFDRVELYVQDAKSLEHIGAAYVQQFINGFAKMLLNLADDFLAFCHIKKGSLFQKSQPHGIFIDIDMLEEKMKAHNCALELNTTAAVPLTVMEFIRKKLGMESVSGATMAHEELLQTIKQLYEHKGKLIVTDDSLITKIMHLNEPKSTGIYKKNAKHFEALYNPKSLGQTHPKSKFSAEGKATEHDEKNFINAVAEMLLKPSFDKACIDMKESPINIQDNKEKHEFFINLDMLAKVVKNDKCPFELKMSPHQLSIIRKKFGNGQKVKISEKMSKEDVFDILNKMKQEGVKLQVTDEELIKLVNSESARKLKGVGMKGQMDMDESSLKPAGHQLNQNLINSVAKMLLESIFDDTCTDNGDSLFNTGDKKHEFFININTFGKLVANDKCHFKMSQYLLKFIHIHKKTTNGKNGNNRGDNVADEILGFLKDMKNHEDKLQVTDENLFNPILNLKKTNKSSVNTINLGKKVDNEDSNAVEIIDHSQKGIEDTLVNAEPSEAMIIDESAMPFDEPHTEDAVESGPVLAVNSRGTDDNLPLISEQQNIIVNLLSQWGRSAPEEELPKSTDFFVTTDIAPSRVAMTKQVFQVILEDVKVTVWTKPPFNIRTEQSVGHCQATMIPNHRSHESQGHFRVDWTTCTAFDKYVHIEVSYKYSQQGTVTLKHSFVKLWDIDHYPVVFPWELLKPNVNIQLDVTNSPAELTSVDMQNPPKWLSARENGGKGSSLISDNLTRKNDGEVPSEPGTVIAKKPAGDSGGEQPSEKKKSLINGTTTDDEKISSPHVIIPLEGTDSVSNKSPPSNGNTNNAFTALEGFDQSERGAPKRPRRLSSQRGKSRQGIFANQNELNNALDVLVGAY